MFVSRGVMFVLVMMSMRSVPAVAPRARMRVVGAPQQAAPSLHRQVSNYQQDLCVKKRRYWRETAQSN